MVEDEQDLMWIKHDPLLQFILNPSMGGEANMNTEESLRLKLEAADQALSRAETLAQAANLHGPIADWSALRDGVAAAATEVTRLRNCLKRDASIDVGPADT